ncbi:MAG: CDC48 family AAA ATPase [Candidatus Nanoarchaeia archaeon]|nr:CDC48 family AAA ATPase [Candidatus Nanoarchaeia archaeon]
MAIQEVKLKVMEALQEEAYKGIVRIDSETMRDLGVRVGDIIEIEGQKLTVGIVDRAYPTDVGLAVIRMDGIMRKNAKTGIGEVVKVRKANVKEAKEVTIAPAQKNVSVQGDPLIFKRGLLGRALIKGDLVVLGGAKRRQRTFTGSQFEDIFEDFFEKGFGLNFNLADLRFVVANTNPKGAIIVTENTSVNLSSKAMEITEEKIPEVTYEDIGGLEEEIRKIREMVEIPIKHPELFSRLGIDPPRGVLLHGPPGTGKTLLAKAVANESEANFMLLNGPEIMNKFYGESEKKVREIFEEAEAKAPSIIFIDEIDAIAPQREEVHGEVERRVVSQLLAMMDGLKGRGKVIVIGATNRPNAIDPALRRPGRFDRELIIGVPDRKGREQVLKIHTRNMPLAKDVDINRIAEVTHGFVGADLNALSKEAAMNVLRRILPDLSLRGKNGKQEEIPDDILKKLVVNADDFREAMKTVRPSGLREVFIETPDVRYEEIGGLEDVKQELRESIEWPLKHPDAFNRLGVRPPKGVLMYGPPGTGKTLLAKAVANESEANFILVKGPSLLNKFVGESEKGVRKVFEKARQAAPTIIFFDEIDALAPRRGLDNSGSRVMETVVNTILAEMDGLEELTDIVVIAATNRPDIIDPALLRPGRFDRIVFVKPPEIEGREKIFNVHTKKMPLGKDVNVKKLAEETEGYTGADIEAVCREAAMLALREDINVKEIKKKHFDKAMKKITGSLTKETIERYESIEQDYLRNAKAALNEKPNYMG